MTAVAGLRDARLGEQPACGKTRHRIVAIAAAELTVGVRRSRPMQALLAFVAVQALPVLHVFRRSPLLRETDQRTAIPRIPDVVRAGAMACFAHLALTRGAGVLAEDPGVQCLGEMPVLDVVATRTGLLADIGGCIECGGLCSRRCC